MDESVTNRTLKKEEENILSFVHNSNDVVTSEHDLNVFYSPYSTLNRDSLFPALRKSLANTWQVTE